MKKKIFALLTALCMTAAVLPAVFADGEEGDLTIGSTQEQCSCIVLCTEGNINSDCPVCAAEGADLSACKGEPVVPVLYGAPRESVTYLDENGNQQTADSATQVTNSNTEWKDGWYVAQGDITIGSKDDPQRVTVKDNVHLILADGCKLTVNGGIGVTGTNSLTIYAQSTDDSMGTLNATGGDEGAGIGGGSFGDGGNITINGGEISANGSGSAAGIGGGYGGSGGKITINGGVVTANSKSDSAGIGGGIFGSGGEINIEGGVVTATGSDNGAGIGGGTMGDGGNITISGGVVKATGDNGTGIGGGYNGSGGSFSADGNAVIFANGGSGGSDIQDNGTSDWSGVIFQGDSGKVYGTNVTPTQNFTIPNDKTLTIDEGKTLTIPAGVTMTNEGTITNNGTIQNEGAIHNNGTIEGSGTLYNNGTLTGNGTVTCKVVEQIQPQPTDPTTPETTAPTDTDHTVQTDNSGHAPVEDNTALPSFWELVTQRINATPRGGEITINMGARAVPDSVLNALRARSLTATFRYGDTELTIAPDQLPPEGMLTEWTLHELGNYVAEADESIRISVEKSEAENATETTAPAADTGKPNPATGETTTTAAALLVAAAALTGLGVTLKKTKR